MKRPLPALVLILSLFCCGLPHAAQAKPLTDADILTLINLSVPSSDIVQTIDKNGYAGATTDDALKQLLQAGAPPEVVLAAKRAATSTTAQNQISPAPVKTTIDPLKITTVELVELIRGLGLQKNEIKAALSNNDQEHPIVQLKREYDQAFKNSTELASQLRIDIDASGLSEDLRKSILEASYDLVTAAWNVATEAAPSLDLSAGHQWLQDEGRKPIATIVQQTLREEIAYYQLLPDGGLPEWAINQAKSMAGFFRLPDGSEESKRYVDHYAKATWINQHAEEIQAKLKAYETQELRVRAEAGDAAAQFEYAANSTTLSASERAGWYRKAAAQGHREAQYYLAEKYLHGEGVERSFGDAMKWYHKAAEQGHLKAQTQLAYYYKGGENYHGDKGVENAAESTKWRLKAAEQGDRESQLIMGTIYEGGFGPDKNIIEAIKWYRKAADQGHWEAQHRLASIFYDGREIPQNHSEAVKWWQMSAEQGYKPALYAMGFCYQHGHGVEIDPSKAVEWYRQAAAKGHEDAKKALQALNVQ